MRARLRIAARILAALLIPLAVVTLVVLGGVQNPGESAYYAGVSEDEYERDLERELATCSNVDSGHALVHIIAGEPLARAVDACAALRASVGPPRARLDADVVARSRAFADLQMAVIDGSVAVGLFAVVLALGGLLAALGLGRIAAGLLIVPCLLAYRYDLLPIALGASVPSAALFLACAHYGDGPRTPSDSRAALIVSLLLVPLVSVAIALSSINSGSGRINVRLSVAFALSALAWATTGIPLSTLIHRARAAAPGQAERPRMLVPRVAISVLILATAASFAGAIAGP